MREFVNQSTHDLTAIVGIEIAGPASLQVFQGELAGSEKYIFKRMEEFAVKVSDIVEKMGGKVPVPAMDLGATIKAVFLFSLPLMGHGEFFLKISTKTQVNEWFFVN